MNDERATLLAANAEFYRAFSAGDCAAMETLWATGASVSCDHPGMPTVRGREAVLDSWRRILAAGGAPGVHATDIEVELCGDEAEVRCVERLGDGANAATNGFTLESGEWRMTSHAAASL